MKNYILFVKENKLFFLILVSLFTLLSLVNINVPLIYDDLEQIISNPTIKKFPNLIAVIFDDQMRMSRVYQNVTFAFDWWISNGKLWSFHLTNNFIHLVNTCLFFYLFNLIFPNKKNILMVTCLIFFWHPLQVQPVTYVMGRIDLLRTFFMLICIISYVENRNKFLTYALLILSLLAKELNVLTPAIFIALDLIVKRIHFKKLNFKDHALYLSHAIWTYPISLIWKSNIAQHGNTLGFSMYPFWEYVKIQTAYLAFYFELYFSPDSMSIYHDYFVFKDYYSKYFITGILIFISIIFLFIYLWKKNRNFELFCLFFFCFAYFPTNSFLQFINPFAEYRLYLSIFFISALLMNAVFSFKIQRKYQYLFFLLFSVYNIYFHQRVIKDWTNPLRIWKFADENYPRSFGINISIGHYLILSKLPEQALPYFYKAEEFYNFYNPNLEYFETMIKGNLGATLYVLKDYKKAFPFLKEVMATSYYHRTSFPHLNEYLILTYEANEKEEFNKAWEQINNFYGDKKDTNEEYKEVFKNREIEYKKLNNIIDKTN